MREREREREREINKELRMGGWQRMRKEHGWQEP